MTFLDKFFSLYNSLDIDGHIDWQMFSTALHEHVLLLRKQSVVTICET